MCLEKSTFTAMPRNNDISNIHKNARVNKLHQCKTFIQSGQYLAHVNIRYLIKIFITTCYLKPKKSFALNAVSQINESLLKRVRRSYNKYFPSVEIIIIYQSCRKSFNGIFVQLCNKTNTVSNVKIINRFGPRWIRTLTKKTSVIQPTRVDNCRS